MSNAQNVSKLHQLAGHIANLVGLSNSKASIDAAVSGGLPAGTVLDFAGPEAKVPAGFLLAAGQAVSRTAYAALFVALGTAHGVGDGSTTFNLPDLRGRVTAGADNMGGTAANRLTTAASGVNGAALGATGGVEAVTLTGAQSGTSAHSHTATNAHTLATAAGGAHTHTYTGYGSGDRFSGPDGTAGPQSLTTDAAPTHTHTITGGITTTVTAATAATATASHSNTQPTVILNKIIKT